MTTDETIQAIDALPGGAPIYIDNYEILEVGKFCRVDDLKQLTAELKLYREFVGAMRRLDTDTHNGYWSEEDEFRFVDLKTYEPTTGTDPFDAFCNMQKEIKLSEVESKDA